MGTGSEEEKLVAAPGASPWPRAGERPRQALGAAAAGGSGTPGAGPASFGLSQGAHPALLLSGSVGAALSGSHASLGTGAGSLLGLEAVSLGT